MIQCVKTTYHNTFCNANYDDAGDGDHDDKEEMKNFIH